MDQAVKAGQMLMKRMTIESKTKYEMNKPIKSLTGLRFIMIMSIVLRHFNYFSTTYPINLVFPYYYNFQVLGVDFFFLLSGFGMMLSDLNKIPPEAIKRPKYVDIGYGIKHVKKIYFLYIATILVSFIPSLFIEVYLGYKYEILKFILTTSLLQSLTGMMYFSHAYNGVAWFLSSLFCIYLVSPFLIFILKKTSNSLITDILWFISSIAIVFLLSYLFESIEDFYRNKPFPRINVLVYESPLRRAFYVLSGMSIAMAFRRIKETSITCDKKYKHLSLYISPIEIIVGIIALIYYAKRNDLHLGNILYIIDILIAATFVFVFAFEKGVISKSLRNNAMQKLGKIAMYIFLIHYPITIYGVYMVERFGRLDNLLIASLFTIFVLSLTFYLSWTLPKKQIKNT